ncbi:hypothetical protein B0H14DRAFT_933893 [Mycena olivaceomarginata]|nr:hypothetical protein B0H14DRAFT_933893 [Mycena olivaceomarginata]
MCGRVAQHVSSHLPVASPALSLPSLAMLSRMRRRIISARITSDALAATRLTLNAIQASTDVFPPLKSSASVVLVIMELSQRAKSNKKGCEHIAKRSEQLMQDIWRQTKDFGVVLPEEVENSVVDIENFFGGLETENAWERFARQDLHKSQVAEYGRLLDEAMMEFSFNLELSIHRLHMESEKRDNRYPSSTYGVCCRRREEARRYPSSTYGICCRRREEARRCADRLADERV